MTAWTPDIRIEYLAPGVDHTSIGTVIEGWIDYSISATRGSSDYITPPYPMSTTVTLLFDENQIPDIELGSWLTIGVYTPTTGTWSPIHSGNVTDMTSSYRAYGLSGFVLEWQLNLTSAISVLQNMTWYNEANYTAPTDDCVIKVYNELGRAQWNQINATTSWENIGGMDWLSFDDPVIYTMPSIFSYGVESTSQTLTAGYRNVWDDLTTLVYGVYGFMYEQAWGAIDILYSDPTSPIVNELTLTQEMLNTDITGGQAINEVRNVVTIIEFDAVESTYYDHESISNYTQRIGSLNSYMNTTLEAANVGQKILSGLAFPVLATKQVSVNLLNPIFSDVDREALLYYPLGRRITVEAPTPMGGTLDYITVGCQFDITKDAFILSLTLAPYSQAWNTPNWQQIPYNYTWDSYGVAFPTQRWMDL